MEEKPGEVRPGDATAREVPARPLERVVRVSISLGIIAVLFLQTVTAFRLTFGPFKPAPYQYPFLNYPMYSAPRYEGEEVERLRVVAIAADGSEQQVFPEDMGLTFWRFQWGPIQAIRHGWVEETRLFAREYERRLGVRPTAFRLEAESLRLTADGLEISESRRLAVMPVEDP